RSPAWSMPYRPSPSRPQWTSPTPLRLTRPSGHQCRRPPMPDRTDVTGDYGMPPWLYPPVTLHTLHETPGQAARDLEAAAEAEVHQAPDGTGLVVLAHAQGLIEEAL